MAESIATGAPAAELDGTAAASAAPDERADTTGQASALARDAGRLAGLAAAVVAPATVLTGLAYYFGWRRERAFAGYFGIDPSMLALSTNDYVLRSVDALFIPFATVLLVVFAALAFHIVLGPTLIGTRAAPVIAFVGLVCLSVGVVLAAGHGISSSYIYLQALAPGVGVVLVVYALAQSRAGRDAPIPLAALRYVTLAVVLVSLFWATAEYADSRGSSQARMLGANLDANPAVTIFSKVDLNINPDSYGGTAAPCVIFVQKAAKSAYPYKYIGFTLLVRSAGNYFVTPAPDHKPWNPTADPVLVIPDNDSIRVELQTGLAYPSRPVERTASGRGLAFTC
jgi:hypothetical protein